ncbi:MAG: hypothetical protein KGM44_08475 [bacterium]|nr:hypothetical protein [bacterium]
MPDTNSVADARKKVGAAYTALLKDVSDRQISQAGSKKTREQLPVISAETGVWRDNGIASKPLAWLVHFEYDLDAGAWKAHLPGVPYATRLTGTFNTKSPLQGVLCRVIPVACMKEVGADAKVQYDVHRYWEWALAFVFPDLAVFTEGGSSGATIDFNPSSGRLESIIEGCAIEQPYVSAALFELNPGDDVWSVGGLQLTYGEATNALRAIINVQPVTVASEEPEDEA